MKNFSDFGIDTRGKTGEIKTVCPKCSADRKKKGYPCLNVNTELGVWHCWHCDWAGGLNNGEWQAPTRKKIYSIPAATNTGLSPDWADWLSKRGISLKTALRNKIKSDRVWFPQIEAENDCIAFPYLNTRKEIINYKYRDKDKNFRLHAGSERIFYGLADLIDQDEVIIVEGEMDKLSCEEAGYLNCVSVPDGAPAPATKNYSSKFDFIQSAEEIISKVKRFILAVDNDAPGRKLQEELIRRLGAEKCFIVSWPEGCKDSNDVLVKHGKAALLQHIKAARPCPVKGIFGVQDLVDQVWGTYQDGVQPGKETGWNAMRGLYTVRDGEWTAVTGIPGHGKSEWLDALMVNLARKFGLRFAIFSPENQPLHFHVNKISEKYVGKPFGRGAIERISPDELQESLEWIGDHFSFVLPEETTLDCVLNLAKIEIFRRGLNGIVIDPWNELDHSRPAGLTETEYISQSLSKVRKFARKNNVHVWLVAHPTKLPRDKDGKYPIPTLSDISGSAHWRNKCDNGIIVWRDQTIQTRVVEIHVSKVRFKSVGRPGRALLNYDYPTGRYFDQESNYQEEGQ